MIGNLYLQFFSCLEQEMDRNMTLVMPNLKLNYIGPISKKSRERKFD